jgi:hypothetical protein
MTKKNLVLTYASEPAASSETFGVFVNSLKNINNKDFVVITHDIKQNNLEKLKQNNAEIIQIEAGEMYYLFRDRHLHFYNYLKKFGSNYEKVLICDSRDVVFQNDPFVWCDKNIKKQNFVAFTAEGFKRSESGFACIEHFEFQRDVPRPYLKENNEKWVCNAGVTIGSTKEIQEFEFLLFVTVMKTIGRCTDQAALNYLMHFFEEDPKYHISLPQNESLCLTGEGVKLGSVEPILQNKELICTKTGEPYCMIHQWDRLNYLREEILAQYGF